VAIRIKFQLFNLFNNNGEIADDYRLNQVALIQFQDLKWNVIREYGEKKENL
jgi:hypothetical protein